MSHTTKTAFATLGASMIAVLVGVAYSQPVAVTLALVTVSTATLVLVACAAFTRHEEHTVETYYSTDEHDRFRLRCTTCRRTAARKDRAEFTNSVCPRKVQPVQKEDTA